MARKEKNKKEVKGFSSFLNNQIDFYIIDNNFAIAFYRFNNGYFQQVHHHHYKSMEIVISFLKNN